MTEQPKPPIKEQAPASPYREKLRNDSLDAAVKEDPTIVESPERLVMRVYEEFKKRQIANFPKLCAHTYRVNKQTDRFHEVYGNKGKYTDTYGWSQDGSMKNKWVLPTDLKLFMENLVYKRFWEEDNHVVRDGFMSAVCKGGTLFDYEQLLKKVVIFYGSDLKNSLRQTASGIASIQ